jgi:hypothetical protein
MLYELKVKDLRSHEVVSAVGPRLAAVTIEKLRDFYHAQPFKPFIIHLADGRATPVIHRDFMMSAPSGRTNLVYQPDDSLNVIDFLLVTDLEIKPVGNGARKRRKA